VFPEELLDRWILVKEDEIRELAGRPHPYEFLLYG